MSDANNTVLTAFKAFDKDFKCRGFQFAVGQSFTHVGEVKQCNSGFHACEYPLAVFEYYPPAGSRFAQVTQSGKLSTGADKTASEILEVKFELDIAGLVKAAIEYTTSRTKKPKASDKKNGAASNSGERGKVMGSLGSALFTLYREPQSGEVLLVWAGIVGQNGVEPNVWYRLNRDGKIEVAE